MPREKTPEELDERVTIRGSSGAAEEPDWDAEDVPEEGIVIMDEEE